MKSDIGREGCLSNTLALGKNCIDEIETIISVKLQLIGIVGIGIAGLTIFGMIFSMVLCCAIRNSRDVI
ncbi:Tetraspanin-2 [Pteropus alecto]|uniref:Tetraspanin-2 n=1 Tax=Pteropus alecto TaxID=9402 RepID=L5K5A2_PTEAL|nr:Tetraspanin-2 [Pteropus alecto]